MRINLLKSTLLLALVFCFFTSKTQSFDKIYSIKGTEILKEEYEVERLTMADTLLIAGLRPESDYHFAIYNPVNLKQVVKFVKKGNGPNEFPYSTDYNGQYEIDNNNLKIWLLRLNANKMYRVNLTKTIESKQTVIDKIVKVKPESLFSRVFYIDSLKIVGRSCNSTPTMNRLQIYNPDSRQIIKTVPLFPYVERTRDDMGFVYYRYNSLYIAGLTLKPDKTKLASVMEMFNRVDIFDTDGDVINTYVDKSNNITKAEIDEFLSAKENQLKDLNIKSYHKGACSSDNYIYTIYSNYQYSRIRDNHPVKIRIFNWKAEPVCEIEIPDHLTSFTVDEKNGVLYGVAYFEEKILKYNIKPILDEIR